MIRMFLDRLYRASGYSASAAIIFLLIAIIIQMCSRVMMFTFDAVELAGYLLAQATFLGLAYTLQHDAHIRVSALLDLLPLRWGQLCEIWSCALGSGLTWYLTFEVTKLFLFSYEFESMAQGSMPIPLWMPQMGMMIGIAVFAIALSDSLVTAITNYRKRNWTLQKKKDAAELHY